MGPVDIVVEGNRIKDIKSVGAPGAPIDQTKRPKAEPGDHEIDLAGHYVLPGFVDLHGHMGGYEQGTPAEYVLKLWMSHGITTSADPGSGNGLDFMVEHKKKSEANQITAPRLKPYVTFGQGLKEPVIRPEQARAFVQDAARRGADGIKFFGLRPDLMAAAIDEAKKLGLRTTCHHAQLAVARLNVLDTARMGLTSMQHWYGLPEALFTDRTLQDYPRDYNYNDEQDRFSQAGRLWKQAAPPGSPRWNAVMDELIKLDFTLSPTFHAYETTRDFMRMSRAEWHEEYTLPSLWRFYTPSRVNHGSYFHYWTTEDEVAWRDNYRLWMAFVNEYKNRGGRVGVGTDSGYTYNLYGFSFVREMELLREAGFHPLEVIRAATLKGAEALGVADSVGKPRARQARRHGGGGREPGLEPEGALRHGRREARRAEPGRPCRRCSLHDQGRHRVRREEAAGRRAAHGARGQGQGRLRDPAAGEVTLERGHEPARLMPVRHPAASRTRRGLDRRPRESRRPGQGHSWPAPG